MSYPQAGVEPYRSTPPTPCLPPSFSTREGWLTEAGRLIVAELFTPADVPTPAKVRVTCALTQGGRNVIGECWAGECSADGTHEITVSAVLDQAADPQGLLATLVHELLHAAVGIPAQHRHEFAKHLPAIGLAGKPTETVASAELRDWFRWSLIPRLGRFPHASLNPYSIVRGPSDPIDKPQPPAPKPRCKPPGRTPQRNRQLLYECPECGQKIRAATRTLIAYCQGQNPDAQSHDLAAFEGRFPAEAPEDEAA